MTNEALEKLNDGIRFHIEDLRKDYHRKGSNKDLVRAASCQYVLGLRDAGLITEQERRAIFLYITACCLNCRLN